MVSFVLVPLPPPPPPQSMSMWTLHCFCVFFEDSVIWLLEYVKGNCFAEQEQLGSGMLEP